LVVGFLVVADAALWTMLHFLQVQNCARPDYLVD
jgi:hypothetical protein